MSSKTQLSEFDIMNWATCPTCGAARGERCRNQRGSDRSTFHQQRTQLANRLASAKRTIEWDVLAIGIAMMLAAAALGAVFGDLILNNMWDALTPPLPEFPPR